MKEILIIDDNAYIGDMLAEVLKKAGYRPLRAYSGTEAMLLLASQKPDLILLDLMLPGLSGEEVLSKIKDIPVIVISAKIDVSDKVNALLGGAADYMTKPFDTNELLARIAVQLRQERAVKNTALTFGDIALDTRTRTVSCGEREIKLTKTEYAVLKILMLKSPNVVTKSELLDSIEADTPDCTESSLKVHMGNLRKKLRSATQKEYVESVWGIGFKLTK